MTKYSASIRCGKRHDVVSSWAASHKTALNEIAAYVRLHFLDAGNPHVEVLLRFSAHDFTSYAELPRVKEAEALNRKQLKSTAIRCFTHRGTTLETQA